MLPSWSRCWGLDEWLLTLFWGCKVLQLMLAWQHAGLPYYGTLLEYQSRNGADQVQNNNLNAEISVLCESGVEPVVHNGKTIWPLVHLTWDGRNVLPAESKIVHLATCSWLEHYLEKSFAALFTVKGVAPVRRNGKRKALVRRWQQKMTSQASYHSLKKTIAALATIMVPQNQWRPGQHCQWLQRYLRVERHIFWTL